MKKLTPYFLVAVSILGFVMVCMTFFYGIALWVEG